MFMKFRLAIQASMKSFSGKIINKISNKVLTVSNSVKNHWLKYIDDTQN